MLSRSAFLVMAIPVVLSQAAMGQQQIRLDIWAVDPLVKVFRDAAPASSAEAFAEAACGEHATFQIVVRSEQPVTNLRASARPLALEPPVGVYRQPDKPRFVGYVPVDRPMQTPPKDQLRKPPAEYPDPLLEVDTIDLPAGQAQPIWITVPVPVQSATGTYRGSLTVTGRAGNVGANAQIPLVLKVHRAIIFKSRLWTTNWFGMHWRHMQISPKEGSPEYWDLLGRYARNMAEHRQNVALISPLALAEFKPGEGDKLQIDFSKFDRWVKIFKDEGVIGMIEGGHIGGRVGGWESQFVVQIRQVKDGKVVSSSVDPGSPEAGAFY
ncbi:MAG: hypothetical protein GX616_08780, partial [Planctomycetes bacterium]|nr:hypothetical protein [Planctomycetota bacterium]